MKFTRILYPNSNRIILLSCKSHDNIVIHFRESVPFYTNSKFLGLIGRKIAAGGIIRWSIPSYTYSLVTVSYSFIYKWSSIVFDSIRFSIESRRAA